MESEPQNQPDAPDDELPENLQPGVPDGEGVSDGEEQSRPLVIWTYGERILVRLEDIDGIGLGHSDDDDDDTVSESILTGQVMVVPTPWLSSGNQRINTKQRDLVGRYVVIPFYAGLGVLIQGQPYRFIHFDDVIAVVSDDPNLIVPDLDNPDVRDPVGAAMREAERGGVVPFPDRQEPTAADYMYRQYPGLTPEQAAWQYQQDNQGAAYANPNDPRMGY